MLNYQRVYHEIPSALPVNLSLDIQKTVQKPMAYHHIFQKIKMATKKIVDLPIKNKHGDICHGLM